MIKAGDGYILVKMQDQKNKKESGILLGGVSEPIYVDESGRRVWALVYHHLKDDYFVVKKEEVLGYEEDNL